MTEGQIIDLAAQHPCRTDNWAIYGDTFTRDARTAMDAAFGD